MRYGEQSQRRLFLFALAGLFCILLLAIYFKAVASEGPESRGSTVSADDRVIAVSNQAELQRALRNKRGGFTVTLAPGNYGSIWVRGTAEEPRFAQLVTIRSAEPCNPAIIQQLTVKGVSNLELQALHFENNFFKKPREELFNKNGQLKNLDLLRTDNVSNITVRDSTFVGPTFEMDPGHYLNGYGYGFGWRGRDIRDVSFTNNDMTNLYKGMSVNKAAGLTIANNTIHDYRSDGIYLVEGGDINIINNRIVDPRPYMLPKGGGDHPDFMQLRDIDVGRIENNYMDVGTIADASQGIFSGRADQIVVRNNIIATRSVNALQFSALTNSDISNNLVVSAGTRGGPSGAADGFGRRGNEPQLRVNPNYQNVTVNNNLASKFSRNFASVAQGGSLLASGNATVQSANPRARNYYAYDANGLAAPSSAGTRIGNVWLASVSPNSGPDPSKFDYMAVNAPQSPDRCALH